MDLPEFLEPFAHDLGRPYDVLGCIPIVHLVCRCAAHTPLILSGMGVTGAARCDHCGRVFALRAVTCEGDTMGVKIDTSVPAPKVGIQ